MKWDDFLKLVGNLPVIETEHLFVGKLSPEAIEVQISRWEKTGKLVQLKRGIYLLSKSYRKIELYEPYVASILKRPSYLSLEKALEYHGMIPEAVPVYTSVTTKRPAKFITKLGTFDYRHIRESLFWGYNSVSVNKQTAFIASPEKALLDLLYLKKARTSLDYLEELRLQNLKKINFNKLSEYAKRFKKQGILNGVEMIKGYIKSSKKGERAL
jgi:predicted transcriptional regulator of viral defense system